MLQKQCLSKLAKRPNYSSPMLSCITCYVASSLTISIITNLVSQILTSLKCTPHSKVHRNPRHLTQWEQPLETWSNDPSPIKKGVGIDFPKSHNGREGLSGRWPGYLNFKKVIFRTMRTTRKQFPVNWLTSGRLAFTISARQSEAASTNQKNDGTSGGTMWSW